MTDRDAEAHSRSVEKIFPRLGETETTANVLEIPPRLSTFAIGRLEFVPGVNQTLSEEESTRPTLKCRRQLIDLVRLYLAFRLPLPCRTNAGEDESNEAVARTPRSEDVADIAGPVSGQRAAPARPGCKATKVPIAQTSIRFPFTTGTGAGPAGPGETQPTPDHSSNPDAGLPFHNSRNLPAGTLLTVRLKHPISTESPGNDGTFEAIVDEPVVVEGNRLVPRGATVSGRVESTRSSNLKRNLGYVRLALDSIHLSGGILPIQTSSLFVRGNSVMRLFRKRRSPSDIPQNNAPTLIHVEKGRRLTFRLTEPAYVSASQRTRFDR